MTNIDVHWLSQSIEFMVDLFENKKASPSAGLASLSQILS